MRYRSPSAPDFAERFAALVDELGLDLVVPGVDEELPAIAEMAVAGRLQALLPPPHFVDRNLDKLESARFLERSGLAPPTTMPAGDAGRIGYPCILKPRFGRGSRDVAIVDSADRAAAYLRYKAQPSGSFIAQELGQGREYTVLMAADRDGVLRAVVPVQVAIKRGVTLRAEIVADEAVMDYCQRVHAVDPVPGCYNIQLIKEESGRILVFEINPRVSTTFCMSLAAGIDPIEIYLAGTSVAEPGLASFPSGLTLQRTWQNHISESSHG